MTAKPKPWSCSTCGANEPVVAATREEQCLECAAKCVSRRAAARRKARQRARMAAESSAATRHEDRERKRRGRGRRMLAGTPVAEAASPTVDAAAPTAGASPRYMLEDSPPGLIRRMAGYSLKAPHPRSTLALARRAGGELDVRRWLAQMAEESLALEQSLRRTYR